MAQEPAGVVEVTCDNSAVTPRRKRSHDHASSSELVQPPV
jgi:hypothetical protein